MNARAPKSVPPPLPASALQLQPARDAANDAFADAMLERLAAGDYEATVIAAEALLEHRPRDRDALDCAQIARTELRKVYIARLGSLERVPHISVGPDAMFSQKGLDFRAGFLVSCVDGVASLAGIVQSSGIPPLDALKILSELWLRRVIAFDPFDDEPGSDTPPTWRR